MRSLQIKYKEISTKKSAWLINQAMNANETSHTGALESRVANSLKLHAKMDYYKKIKRDINSIKKESMVELISQKKSA